MNLEYYKNIRMVEISQIIPFIQKGSDVLEIGAGSGYQARILSEHGFKIVAIDVRDGLDNTNQVWPVIEYDGTNIPFPGNHFEAVFTSNVLEHVSSNQLLGAEIKRVLKPNGIVIHSLPTATWRIHTIFAHYLFLIKRLMGIALPFSEKSLSGDMKIFMERTSILKKIRKIIFASKHGVRGNILTEIYYFSRFYWFKFFHDSGWIVDHHFLNRLFYSGYVIFGSQLSISTRHFLSYVLGSSGHIFILKKRI